jgi:hypothetical protein
MHLCGYNADGLSVCVLQTRARLAVGARPKSLPSPRGCIANHLGAYSMRRFQWARFGFSDRAGMRWPGFCDGTRLESCARIPSLFKDVGFCPTIATS